jgi:hypothetical protein
MNPEQQLSQDVIRELEGVVRDSQTLLDYHPCGYTAGTEIDLRLLGVHPPARTDAKVFIEKPVGGGFAGQVYKVRFLRVEPGDSAPLGIERGPAYAMKIIVPPSRFSRAFRNALFAAGYQGSFPGQSNPAAVQAGALWQKFIRRGAALVFGTQNAVVDVYATFYDPRLRSFGEVSEWVDGRLWRYEIDEAVFARRKRGTRGKASSLPPAGSGEYVAKKRFMAGFVRLLHEMGAPELARQYEWWTCKSQPNVLKRSEAGSSPEKGLTAIDFRAGLVLLPFLPMSPADFKLIVKGILRGDPVQFDRGDTEKLEAFVLKHRDHFEDLLPSLERLKETDRRYRRSLPDITHHHVELLADRPLRRDVAAGVCDAWYYRGLADRESAERLKKSPPRFLLYYLLGFLPFLGKFVRKLLGRKSFARHVASLFQSRDYLGRAARAFRAGTLANWHRRGRLSAEKARGLLHRPLRFFLQWFFLGWMPAGWHRCAADPAYTWGRIKTAVSYPVKLYFNREFREEWLRQQIATGCEEGMLSEEEAERITGSIQDPFIQKYLKCVAVHLCTLPVTQLVSVAVALYVMLHYGQTWKESLLYAAGVLALFQGTPISPGSLTRGVYVWYLVIRERDIKSYWVAALVSFWHYVGYLGFPLQMVTRFPVLAQFLAGRWATQMVHFVPVFGERGALLEHWIFDLFFNVPLTLRKRLFRR